MSSIRYSLVAAICRNSGIGLKNGLPWRLSQDMKHFKDVTTKTNDPNKMNAVIIGRVTYTTLSEKFRPLPGRINIVISRQANTRAEYKIPEDVFICSSLDEALIFTQSETMKERIESVFVIGGSQVYAHAMKHPECDHLYITHIDEDYECDSFFPPIEKESFVEDTKKREEHVDEKKGTKFVFTEYARKRMTPLPYIPTRYESEEMQYLMLVKHILENGSLKVDRTKVGTRSIFGVQMRFDLQNNNFPLLTTKKVFWRGVVEEMLWFIRGGTNCSSLQEKGVKIWSGNGSRTYLDSIGLSHYEEQELGPVYGFQWRHFGAEYIPAHRRKEDGDGMDHHQGEGVDQIKDIIHLLLTDPSSRRIVLSAWNPCDLSRMALPPCHVLAQFYVSNGYLSCQMYQRSADMGLGVPFNIASYALLTVMLAKVTGYQPGEFVHTIGDAHVYCNHESALSEQITRTPKPFPKLYVDESKEMSADLQSEDRVLNALKQLESFAFEDFRLEGYNPDSSIKMQMAV